MILMLSCINLPAKLFFLLKTPNFYYILNVYYEEEIYNSFYDNFGDFVADKSVLDYF